MPQFKPRQREHKARRRATQNVKSSISDTNLEEIIPEHQKELKDKHASMKALLRAEQPKMSSKKQKRLDKYIDTKLRKEETLELLKKLAGQKVDTSLFRSSKNLGVSKDSKRSILTQALRKERAGISTPSDEALLYTKVALPVDIARNASESDSSNSDMLSPKVYTAPLAPASSIKSIVTGAGLKRPLEVDARGDPVIKKRVRINARISRNQETKDAPWEGFSTASEAGSESESASASNNSSDLDEDSEGDSDDQYAALFSAVEQRRSEKSDVTIQTRARSDFKAWATQQMNEARDFTPSQPISNNQISNIDPSAVPRKPRELEIEPLPSELQIPSNTIPRQAHSVQVDRSTEIQESRLKLPIVAEEQRIMEAIHNNPVVVVCGATGSGKTTQVPQFLFEAGYGSSDGPTPGMIGITQPRRVAAVTMAKRVAYELGNVTDKVSHQVRFDSTVGKETAIKFMTDGILVREIANDFALMKYSAIVIDEAHERSVNTDILIGMISRIVDLRKELSKDSPEVKPLKVIIMSATLMVEAFTNNEVLFRHGPPPLVQSEGRQYPVTTHFARRTSRDYVDEMFNKILKGHRKLPPGAMLVFLTGQNEIRSVSERLKQQLGLKEEQITGPKVRVAAKDVPLETEDLEIGEDDQDRNFGSSEDNESDGDEDAREFDVEDAEPSSSKVMILPLYSQLPAKEQLRVFEAPPENTRVIILATNVAETSITIPDVRYVFDCGRVKEKNYDKKTGVQSFEIGWISKASAAQRAGRAGRTGPGHCYRMYSSAVYERDFSEHTIPEILKTPAEGVVLQLKSMDLQHVVSFPFPTPPERADIVRGENLLAYLGALDGERKITSIGRELSVYPLSPRFAKMLCIGHQHNCIYLVTAMVAALAIPDIFIPEDQLDLRKSAAEEDSVFTNAQRVEDTAREALRKRYNKAHHFFAAHDAHADGIKLLSVFCAYVWNQTNSHGRDSDDFCASHFLRPKALKEAAQLYQQLLSLIALNRPGSLDPTQQTIAPPSKVQISALKQIAAAGFLDQVAIRADLAPSPPAVSRTPRRAIDVPYLTLFPSHERQAISASSSPTDTLDASAVFIHPASVLSHSAPAALPPFLIYSRLQRGTAAHAASTTVPRTRMHPIAPASGAQLASLAAGTPLLEYGKPIGKVLAVEGEPGRRDVWVVPSLVGERGGRAWPLPAVKLRQIRKPGGVWETEAVAR